MYLFDLGVTKGSGESIRTVTLGCPGGSRAVEFYGPDA